MAAGSVANLANLAVLAKQGILAILREL